jgi:hypothetical protein
MGKIGRSKVHEDANGKHLVDEIHPILKIEFGGSQ